MSVICGEGGFVEAACGGGMPVGVWELGSECEGFGGWGEGGFGVRGLEADPGLEEQGGEELLGFVFAAQVEEVEAGGVGEFGFLFEELEEAVGVEGFEVVGVGWAEGAGLGGEGLGEEMFGFGEAALVAEVFGEVALSGEGEGGLGAKASSCGVVDGSSEGFGLGEAAIHAEADGEGIDGGEGVGVVGGEAFFLRVDELSPEFGGFGVATVVLFDEGEEGGGLEQERVFGSDRFGSFLEDGGCEGFEFIEPILGVVEPGEGVSGVEGFGV